MNIVDIDSIVVHLNTLNSVWTFIHYYIEMINKIIILMKEKNLSYFTKNSFSHKIYSSGKNLWSSEKTHEQDGFIELFQIKNALYSFYLSNLKTYKKLLSKIIWIISMNELKKFNKYFKKFHNGLHFGHF